MGLEAWLGPETSRGEEELEGKFGAGGQPGEGEPQSPNPAGEPTLEKPMGEVTSRIGELKSAEDGNDSETEWSRTWLPPGIFVSPSCPVRARFRSGNEDGNAQGSV
jgi:hypothetical protein